MDEAKARLLIQRIDASIEMLNQTKQDILDFLVSDSLAQIKELEENEQYTVEPTFIGDDGKEYKCGTAYLKAKTWYCCGYPLQKEVKNGKQVYHCSKCGTDYSS